MTQLGSSDLIKSKYANKYFIKLKQIEILVINRTGIHIHFFNFIMIDGNASVVFGSFPFQCAPFFMYVTDIQRSFWFTWLICDSIFSLTRARRENKFTFQNLYYLPNTVTWKDAESLP